MRNCLRNLLDFGLASSYFISFLLLFQVGSAILCTLLFFWKDCLQSVFKNDCLGKWELVFRLLSIIELQERSGNNLYSDFILNFMYSLENRGFECAFYGLLIYAIILCNGIGVVLPCIGLYFHFDVFSIFRDSLLRFAFDWVSP